MAFDLGSIRATLGLDESNFVRGMINAESASAIFGERITQFVNNPLLGTVRLMKDVTAGIARTVVETAKSNKELADWADRLGISTEALSALGLEARSLGIEVEDVADTIGEFGVKARDAVNGSEDLLNTFARIGVTVTDRNGELRNLEDILLDVARGLSEVENETERFAIADELASDGAKRLLPVLERLGREGYDPLIARARDLGHLLTTESADASREFAGALTSMTVGFEGFKRHLSTEFIRGFADEIDNVDGSVRTLTGTLNNQFGPTAEKIGGVLGRIVENDIADWINGLIDGLEALWAILAPVAELVGKLHEGSFTGAYLLADLVQGNIAPSDLFKRTELTPRSQLQPGGPMLESMLRDERQRRIARATGV